MFSVYAKCLRYPRLMLGFVLLLCALAITFWPRFTFEASSDALVVEGDPDLAYYREIEQRFGGESFLFLTYTPRDRDLFSEPALAEVDEIQTQLEAISGVGEVFSILDAPLLKSASDGSVRLSEDYLTLRSKNVDKQRARQELVESPLYADLLVSGDGRTTALRISVAIDSELETLRSQRKALREGTAGKNLDPAALEARYAAAKRDYAAQRQDLIDAVRQVRDQHTDQAQLYLGGVPMIAADMIAYVKSDVLVFGVLVTLAVIVMLYIFFRRLRWVVLPLACSGLSIVLLVGWLGLIRQPITVVSSNALALLAIFSLSFSIHLVVRYRELFAREPDASQAWLVQETMRSKFAPCFYTALTTIVAFASLSTSDILPVEDFGWMMCMGISFSLLIAYSFFPALLLLLRGGESQKSLGRRLRINDALSRLSRHHAPGLLLAGVVLTVITGVGLSQVSLDNRFIDYFKDETEIRAGMQYIDQQLGGTVPFEVIVSFEPYEAQALEEDDPFFFEEAEAYPEKYWFTPDKLHTLRQLHQYLEGLPQTGKIISLSTLEEIAREFNEGESLDAIQLAVVLEALPAHIREQMIAPYADPASGQMRISGRIRESGPMFSRDGMISDIEHKAQQLGLADEQVEVTGMMVLFNNMLRKLFDSQTSTLVYVLLATFAMFAFLLRSVSLAVLGLLPNVLSAGAVIAVMGYAGIPLDMMTITIAAISIGIGVDDAIHYLHRFRQEYAAGGQVGEAIKNSHGSIGRAMYFTSITVIAGFSVLSFSNFVPTIYFGLLTALAMLFAMLANLTLLPALLMLHPGYNRAPQGQPAEVRGS